MERLKKKEGVLKKMLSGAAARTGNLKEKREQKRY